MSKVVIFILGLLIGINAGYCIMIPARDSWKQTAHDCVDSYIKSSRDWKESNNLCQQNYKESTAGWKQCISELSECTQDLSLLQGRSR